jgi:hypothetical protein
MVENLPYVAVTVKNGCNMQCGKGSVRYEEYYGGGMGGTLKKYLKKPPGKWNGCARVNIDPF